jgi:hypothetical protein
LAAVWESEIVPMLARAPDLRAVAIFEEIRRRRRPAAEGAISPVSSGGGSGRASGGRSFARTGFKCASRGEKG